MLVVGGWSFDSTNKSQTRCLSDVETFNPKFQSRKDIENFPYCISGHRITKIKDMVVICGGMDEKKNARNECYKLYGGQSTWMAMPSMNHRRSNFGMATINRSHILVFGGISDYDGMSTAMNKIEIFDGRNWHLKKDAPIKINSGCLLSLNESHLITIGGIQNNITKVLHMYSCIYIIYFRQTSCPWLFYIFFGYLDHTKYIHIRA